MAFFDDYVFTIEPIELEAILEWLSLPFPLLLWDVFRYGGWLVLFFVSLRLFKDYWVGYLEDKYDAARKSILLAIDVPRDNEQTPFAVENIFSTLSGIAGGPNFLEKYWHGVTPESYSFEIVSIDGYVQFLVRCNKAFRDLVESAFYAQYPEIEITEVDDYVDAVPQNFPNETHNLFGMELKAAKNAAYPIKTYSEFEHQMSQELKDPLASLLENMSRLQVGEQVWIQYVATPVFEGWKDGAQAEIDSFLGRSAPSGGLTQTQKIVLAPFSALVFLMERSLAFFGFEPFEVASAESEDKLSKLTPGQREVVAAMEKKICKMGYEIKMRMIYVGRNEVFSKARGVAPIVGALRQYNTLDKNSIVPDGRTVTKAIYFFEKSRIAKKQNIILSAYKSRSTGMGGAPFVLNLEELATLYHFPDVNVKVPLLKRTTAKRSEPPVGLPIELSEGIFDEPEVSEEEEVQEEPEVVVKEDDIPALEPKEEFEFEESAISTKEKVDKEEPTSKDLEAYFASFEREDVPLPALQELEKPSSSEDKKASEPVKEAVREAPKKEVKTEDSNVMVFGDEEEDLPSSGGASNKKGKPPGNLPIG